MKLPLYWIDAFTDRVFAGNPAAVVPLETWPDAAVLQQIAFENGLSETAFVVRTGPARFHLRWFTPALEVDLCGHATLAAAFTLFTQCGQPAGQVVFDTKSGPLTVVRRTDGKVEMDFPARAAGRIDAAEVPAPLRESLAGAQPGEWLKVTTHAHYVALFATAAEVRALQPDFARMASLGDARLLATAPGSVCDFVSRYFAPGAGVPEDPVTGSAHSTLVPYWAGRLGKTILHARQVSARGGELWCEHLPAPGAGESRVRIAGQAVLYLRGELHLP